MMTDKTVKPIPKSLHTVTVLVKLARYLKAASPRVSVPPRSWDSWLDAALMLLDYSKTPDTHELRAAALKQLEAAR